MKSATRNVANVVARRKTHGERNDGVHVKSGQSKCNATSGMAEDWRRCGEFIYMCPSKLAMMWRESIVSVAVL